MYVVGTGVLDGPFNRQFVLAKFVRNHGPSGTPVPTVLYLFDLFSTYRSRHPSVITGLSKTEPKLFGGFGSVFGVGLPKGVDHDLLL